MVMRNIARYLGVAEIAPTTDVLPSRANRRTSRIRILAFAAPLALAAGAAEAQQTPAGACLVEKVNQNGNSIGNPTCPQRGDLARLGGDKDHQLFLVLGHRAPSGTFSLQSQNGQFDTDRFVLGSRQIRPFLSNAPGQEPHS